MTRRKLSAQRMLRTYLKTKLSEVLHYAATLGITTSAMARVRDGPMVASAAVCTQVGPQTLAGSVTKELYLSEVECLIVVAIGCNGYYQAKQIARSAGVQNDAPFRILLANLVQRSVLCHGENGQGYSWHPNFRALAAKLMIA